MQRGLQVLKVLGLLATAGAASTAWAQEPTDPPPEKETSAPPEAVAAEPPAPPPAAAPMRPKFGDITTSGYFRGSFGASNQKGRMTCFQLATGLVSKYRLGNECEVWGEYHVTSVVYAGEDGSVASLHFMPAVYIPTTNIGYSPNGTTSSPALYTSSTGATLSFPNLYADIKGIPWLFGGTAWAGTRYYKRESVYISDFFYWNPSGVGAGIEDIQLGNDVRLSYGAFAVDGLLSPVDALPTSPSLPKQTDFGLRNDVQLRGIHPWPSGELQFGFQYIANYSNNPETSGGWGGTFQYVQKLLGGDNKLALQYGRGGGTGFGTLARFYYPDFSLRHNPKESRIRVVDVVTVQPTPWLGAQVAGVFQRDDLGTMGSVTDWYSAGGRVSVGFTEHAKVLAEAGFDRLQKNNGSDPLQLIKMTIAPAIAASRGLWGRPELRLFYTWALWTKNAAIATVDSGQRYTSPDENGVYTLSGSIFGLQAEAMW
jgi:maltoporin